MAWSREIKSPTSRIDEPSSSTRDKTLVTISGSEGSRSTLSRMMFLAVLLSIGSLMCYLCSNYLLFIPILLTGD